MNYFKLHLSNICSLLTHCSRMLGSSLYIFWFLSLNARPHSCKYFLPTAEKTICIYTRIVKHRKNVKCVHYVLDDQLITCSSD